MNFHIIIFCLPQLTVIVKSHPDYQDCTSRDFQTYQAQSHSLPATFVNGAAKLGPYDLLELVEVEPGRHVEIHIRYIDTIIVIRQIGRYFTFSVRMPEELVNRTSGDLTGDSSNDLDLCVKGCPAAEQINYQEYLSTRRHTKPRPAHASHTHVTSSSSSSGSDAKYSSEGVPPRGRDQPMVSRVHAERVCRGAQLVDFYFDSCVFDLMTTGDENFTLSALSALRDHVQFQPSAARTMANRTSLDLYDRQYGGTSGAAGVRWGTGGGRTSGVGGQLVGVVLLTLLLTQVCLR